MPFLTKYCVVCGKRLQIRLDENQNILSGGHYFGKMEVPAKDAKIIKSWKDKIGGFEYWECEECYTGDR
ncbi:hypothetical protein BMS3Abin16_01236 [archaeon BMS3Abin16]|nr:hypothetical protein BMS3Abin16_01236 [archaeon BMS3Abin16]HDY74748.1 hypothetical protein [Euryarchaeota archaeon]